MLSRELHNWIPSFFVVALAHGVAWYGFTHHRAAEEGPRILPIVQVSLVNMLPPRNHVTALREKITPPKRGSAPETPQPVVENSTAARQAPATTREHSEPVYSAAYLHNQPPAYPLSARRRGIEGTVLLRVEIHASGNCQHVYVKRSSGHEMLDRAAIEAVRRWRFIPARRGNQPVTASAEIPIAFRLQS